MKRLYFLLAFLLTFGLANAGLETGVDYIDDLVITNPTNSDDPSEGDDHLRLTKKAVKQSFPNVDGAVTPSVAEFNILDGVTSTTAELNILDGVTADATELNYNDVTTLGTVEASKAVTADGSGVTTNAAFASPVLNTAVSGTAVLDEDDMTSDSATQIATQQSIKAYVDASIPEVFTSSWYSISVTTLVSGAAIAHGLSAQPQLIVHELKCIDAGGDQGYSQNDIVSIDADSNQSNRGVSTTIDATNLTIRYGAGSSGNVFTIINKSTGNSGAATNSKWNYRVRAVLF